MPTSNSSTPSSLSNLLTLTDAPAAKLTMQQSAFKKLVADIDAAERNLQQLAHLMNVYERLFDEKLTPLRDEYVARNIEMVSFLDGEIDKKGFTKKQRENMRVLICALAEQLFDSRYDEAAKSIFDKHSDISSADLLAEESAALEDDLSSIFGIDPKNKDGQARTADELFDEVLKTFETRRDNDGVEADSLNSKKRKTPARPSKMEQQALDAKALIKDIYRKLSSANHPDREPDETERKRKTALMSEVNSAYESGNLLKLLQLQQAFGKLSQTDANLFADEKLVLINQKLAGQLLDLRMEQFQLEDSIKMAFAIDSRKPVTDKLLDKTLKAEAKELRDTLVMMRSDLAAIRLNSAALKRWVNDQCDMMFGDDDDDDFY